MSTQTIKLDCGHTGAYGTWEDGRRLCYACCGDMDRQYMRDNGRIILYLADGNVTNWPGTLSLPVMRQRKGRHNMAGVRYDVWFRFEGESWHGTQYGDFTQIVHCKRIK